MLDNIDRRYIYDEDEDGLGAARGLINALAGLCTLLVALGTLWLFLATF